MSATGATYKADDLPEWDGKDATYSRFTRKIAKYKWTHKDQHMDNDFWTASNPRLRARVTRRRRATANDPTGTTEGEWIEAESEDEYKKTCWTGDAVAVLCCA